MNLNQRIDGRAVLWVLILAAGGTGVYFGGKHMQAASRAGEEARLEAPEISQCKQNLAALYDAWSRYRADHKGQSPPSVESMIPKYIKNPDILMCPTATRLAKQHIHLQQGVVIMPNGGPQYRDTYGFKWLGAGYQMQLQGQGDKIPLIVCTAHREAMFIETYQAPPKGDPFSAANRGSLIGAVQEAPVLAARKNGKIEDIKNDGD